LAGDAGIEPGLVCMYVDFYISAYRMDIVNSGVTWDLDKTCKASNVSML
jgi:hypothetical protein